MAEEYEYKYADEHIPWMKEQVWECRPDLRIYSQLSAWEHAQVEDLVPAAPKTVMDLGCGLGRAAIYLDQVVYKDSSIFYVLADRDGMTPTNTGAWGALEYYNKLDLTESFARLNGMRNFITFETNDESWTPLPKFDFITSRYAFGVHQPIEPYLEKLLEHCTDDVTLLLGTRDGHYSNASPFDRYFKTVVNRTGARQNPFPAEDWLYAKDLK